jgi:hypothetical protein
MGFGSLSSYSIPAQIDAVDKLWALIELMADPSATKEKVAEYDRATGELRAAHVQLLASQTELAAAEAASLDKLAAARTEHDAALAKAQQEFDARRLQHENALAAREARLAQREAKAVADAEANEALRADLERRLSLLRSVSAA